MITRTTTVDIELTPRELAAEFWRMDADEQAEFFNVLHDISLGLSFQLHAVMTSGMLTSGGRIAMMRIGEYSDEAAK